MVFACVWSKPRPLGPSKLRVKEGGYRLLAVRIEERFLNYADRKKKSVCSGRNDGVAALGVTGEGGYRLLVEGGDAGDAFADY
jgi:hypothetical protein